MSEPTVTPHPRAIVIGHGDFPAGLISAVGQITGLSDSLIGLSNTGMTPADIEALLRTHIAEGGIRVIFTDLPAGSPMLAARRVARDFPDLMLVSGANLATLLDFVCSPAATPAEAARACAERGRASLIVLGGT